MTATPTHPDIQSALHTAIAAHVAELVIDPRTIWCPSPHAVAARRPNGSLLRIDFGEWPAASRGR
jgi:hypothetical protein